MDDTEPGGAKDAVRPKTPDSHAKKESTKATLDVVEKGKNDKKPPPKSPVPGGVSFNADGGNATLAPGKEVDIRRKSSWGTFSRVVLCAIDASVCARYAFEWYLNNVWQKDDLIVLVHIPEAPNLMPISLKDGLNVPVEVWKKSLDKMNTKMRKLEEDFEGECIKRKLKYKIRSESFKNPGEGICILAEDEQADMIVMGSRGVGAFKRALLGSVSEFVIRHAGIPCIIIRAKKLK